MLVDKKAATTERKNEKPTSKISLKLEDEARKDFLDELLMEQWEGPQGANI